MLWEDQIVHEITGNQDAVLKLLKDTIHQLGQDSPRTKKAGIKSLGLRSESQWPSQRDQIIDILKRGYDNEQPKKRLRAAGVGVIPNERAIDSWYAPRNRAIAVFQAAMDEYLDEHLRGPKTKRKKGAKALSIEAKSKDQVQPRATLDMFYVEPPRTVKAKAGSKAVAAKVIEQFSNLDPGWSEVALEKASLLIKGRHKFIKHTSATDFRFPLPEETTIAIVGDWGGGNAAAQAVAEQIKENNPDYVIHLGDVYYAGTESEIVNRFLEYWPSPAPPGKSFALNSNHEMYSGGYSYFDVTLKQFKQPASYFSLANNNWRFIGLDTGYVDHDLNKEQVDWLSAQFKGQNPKTILLSHHQLFSAYEDTNADNLMSRVQPFLTANQIYGWFWGHEHLCVVYKDHLGIKARCLGNGCLPYNLPSNKPQIPVEWINDRSQPDDLDYRGIHSFAVLKVSGQKIDIEYIDQDGYVGYRETWT
jgi:calcineurin-like phosphoesterase family protein